MMRARRSAGDGGRSRLRACMCYHALATLFFDANRGQEEWYADDLDRAKKLL